MKTEQNQCNHAIQNVSISHEISSECVCVCVCGGGHVYVVYEDTNLYNDMGITQVLQGEGDLWGHFQCPHNLKRL